MSTLLVDVGNTRWKLALAEVDGPRVIAQGGHDEYARFDLEVMRLGETAKQALFASVAVSAVTQRLQSCLERYVTDVRRVLSTDAFPGLEVAYRDPGQLGVDRVLAMFAVRASWSGPFCVIDAGTAVTIDFVDAQGQHLGGFILPGRTLARDCLLRGTAIPVEQSTDETALLGRDTAGAISLGGRYAVAGVVRHVSTLPPLAAFVERGRTFVGGGDAAAFEKLLPEPVQRIEQPVLRGLFELAGGGRA